MGIWGFRMGGTLKMYIFGLKMGGADPKMQYFEGKMPPNGVYWGQNGGEALKWLFWGPKWGGEDPKMHFLASK